MKKGKILPDQVVVGAIQHMNEDHGQNLLDYARNLARLSWAEEAKMLSLDVEGFDLKVTGDGRTKKVRIKFDSPLTSANQLRPTLVELAQRAKK